MSQFLLNLAFLFPPVNLLERHRNQFFWKFNTVGLRNSLESNLSLASHLVGFYFLVTGNLHSLHKCLLTPEFGEKCKNEPP